MNASPLNRATLNGTTIAPPGFAPTRLTAAVAPAPGLIDPTRTVVTDA